MLFLIYIITFISIIILMFSNNSLLVQEYKANILESKNPYYTRMGILYSEIK